MGSITRAITIYLFLLIIFRLAGKRTLSDATTFDFVLILIISEAIQQALIDSDNSMTNAMLLVITLVFLNIMFSLIKQRWPAFERVVEGLPVLVMTNGKQLKEAMDRERIGEEDIMHAARREHGLRGLKDIESAVLEPSGGISVIPYSRPDGGK